MPYEFLWVAYHRLSDFRCFDPLFVRFPLATTLDLAHLLQVEELGALANTAFLIYACFAWATLHRISSILQVRADLRLGLIASWITFISSFFRMSINLFFILAMDLSDWWPSTRSAILLQLRGLVLCYTVAD